MVGGADYPNTLFAVSHCSQYSLHSRSIFLLKGPEDALDAPAVDVFSIRSCSSRTPLEAQKRSFVVFFSFDPRYSVSDFWDSRHISTSEA